MSNIHSPHSRWAMAKFRKGKSIARHGATTLRDDKNFSKSSAQVETLVSPRAVSPKSGELKLKAVRRTVSPKQRRRNPLTVRLSDSEREKIKTKAANLGVPLNSYVRAAALGSDYTPPRDPELLALLRLTLRELLHEGNNLNQLAKATNSGLLASGQIAARLDAIRGPLLKTLSMVRTALARRTPHP